MNQLKEPILLNLLNNEVTEFFANYLEKMAC